MQEVYTMLLSQGIGAPSVPAVSKGETVKRGQLIARIPKGKLGSNLHTSVSGTVTEVTETAIRIQASKKQTADYEKLSAKTPLELVKESGLVGLGGAGFPTYAKLEKPFTKRGTVIVNAAECEPILRHNVEFIEKHANKVVRGLQIAMEITHAAEGVIAIKSIHKDAVQSLMKVMTAPNVRVSLLPNMYPMGEERALVREVLGKLLPVTSLPSAADAVVINAETARRITEAVDERKPMIDKDMTVAGKLSGELIQAFFDVPLGTEVREMLRRAGGVSTENYGEIIMGGPFTGKRTSLDAPVVKTCGGILVAEAFWKGPAKLGLLVCACGANEARLRQIAASMGSEVSGVAFCKQALEPKPGAQRKCENPGHCPGQVGKVMALKRDGAEALLISNCTDCTNTVMSCAPSLHLPVYHATDGALRAVNQKLIRKAHSAD